MIKVRLYFLSYCFQLKYLYPKRYHKSSHWGPLSTPKKYKHPLPFLYGSYPWDFVVSLWCAYEPGATVIQIHQEYRKFYPLARGKTYTLLSGQSCIAHNKGASLSCIESLSVLNLTFFLCFCIKEQWHVSRTLLIPFLWHVK